MNIQTFSGRAIDLPPEASASDLSLLWSELRCEDREREGSLPGRGPIRSAPCARSLYTEEWLDSTAPRRLESRERGHLDTLLFQPFALPACGEREVLIEVKAAGMNFRDVLEGACTLSRRSTGCSYLWGTK